MAPLPSILNDPPTTLPGPSLLHDLIDFEKHSKSCAIDFTKSGRRERYTYGELGSCVENLVLQIQESLRHDTRSEQHTIPILVPQSAALYISQLAVIHSGGAFCPINLDAPKERVKFVVGDVTASVIISTEEFKDLVSWENGPKVIFVQEFPEISPRSVNGATKRSTSHVAEMPALAYVMYTSGSSGTPKGVQVSHQAVTQSILAHETHIPRFDRFLQFAAPSFDVSVFEIFFPLFRGATLVGCERSQLLDDLPGMINTLEVDAAELTPTVVGSLLQKRSKVPGLNLLLTIGEMLTRPIVEEFGGSETKKSMLWGMYGPTEAAIHCTVHPEMKASAKPGNIGIPLDTVAIFIAKPDSTSNAYPIELLPVGEVGELVLSGPQLAEGYLNRPDQNKAAFIVSNDSTYYRTGDKAVLLEDGSIEVLGRMSAGQVKLRGQRVELGEVEDAVYKHPNIRSAVATVLGSVLVVFALTGNTSIVADAVSSTCAKWLPKFMVPSEIVLLQKFPYLPSGKVDKKRLELDYYSQRGANDSDIKLTPAEHTIKGILEPFLGLVRPDSRLASLGLDSLSAIRIASALRSAGFNVSTLDVLKSETIISLASACEKSKPPAKLSSQTTSDRGNLSDVRLLNGHGNDAEMVIPCTPLQLAMLAETLIDVKAYRNWVELELLGISEFHMVCSILRDLALRNPILRTGFIESQESGGFSQVVWKTLDRAEIRQVETFDYNFSKDRDTSFHYPIRFQILVTGSGSRILIHLHHALYDGWSLELIMDDLETALLNEVPVSRPAFQKFVDGFSNGSLDSSSWASKDYWKDHLVSLEARQMPNFHSQKQPISALDVVQFQSSISTSEIEKAARSLISSPQAIFQAAYGLVLSSYLASPDICFGTVFSGRTLPIADIENIVGPCLSTLPIRLDISISGTFRELVQSVNSINRKHLEYSELPLRDIKAAAGIMPGQSLFDTLIIWQQTLHNHSHHRRRVSLLGSTDSLEFGLTLEVIPGIDTIGMKANYQTSLFPAGQIDLLLHQVHDIMKLIIQDDSIKLGDTVKNLDTSLLSIDNEYPNTAPGSSSMFSPTENIAASTISEPESLVSQFERFAAQYPARPALSFAKSLEEDGTDIYTTSYQDLNTRANKLSRYLRAQDVFPDELICICMEKSVDLYTSILAVAKSGAGYLPVTPDTPIERLKHIILEAKIKIIVAQSCLRPLLNTFGEVKIIYVDEVDLSKFSDKNLSSRYEPENVSYCIYTSGSTGTPKGVLVTHGNLLSNLQVLEEIYPSSTELRLLQSCSQAFDVSVFEIFFTWRVGGCLCFAVKDVLFQDIEKAIRILDVTHLSMTPTVAALVEPHNIPKVEFLVTAGEAVTPKVFESWAGRGLYQGYGPSETTNICTVRAAVTQHDFINNIGKPLRNTSVFVLSPNTNFAPVLRGGEGEFCFGGSQVFKGYLNHQEEIGRIFDHPQYGRLYRSGDYGRLMPDGSLAFTGRKDDQIKIRGQRVELGEITSLMLRSPEVRDCVTMLVKGRGEAQFLVCFWTSGSGNGHNPKCLISDPGLTSTLYKLLESSLPAYMVPSTLIEMSYLPSTRQGKVDKRMLEAQFNALEPGYLKRAVRTSASPENLNWSELEMKIVKSLAIVTDIRVEDVNLNTSFFALGIDSISAISLARQLRDATGKQVDISEILKNPSVARLSERLSSHNKKVIAPSYYDEFDFDQYFKQFIYQKFNHSGKIVLTIQPCTPLQVAMLSAAEASDQSSYYNHVVFEVAGNLNKLQDCWQEMATRHEILRTCFVSTEMAKYPFVQIVLDRHETTFESITAKTLSEAYGQISNSASYNEMAPPYKLSLFHSMGSMKLIVTMHHALYDGVALSLLYAEIEALYNGQPLSPPISFAPFLNAIASIDSHESDKFWDGSLSNCLPSRLAQREDSTIYISRDKGTVVVTRRTSPIPLSWFEQKIKDNATSLLAVLQSVWASVISELLQNSDICFGNVCSGRTLPVTGIENLVAPCFNTIPVRLRDTHKLSFSESFRELQTFNADSLPFQMTPLRILQSRFSPDGLRLFDTLLILQQPSRTLDPSIWSIIEDNGAMDLPLVCEVVPKHSDDTIDFIFHSHSSSFSEDNCNSIIHAFETTLSSALENPRRQLLSPSTKEIISTKVIYRQRPQQFSENETSSVMSSGESKIRDLIAQFTDLPKTIIKKDASIFRLGLDSISTVQLAASLRKEGFDVRSSDVLENPTIAQLNIYLEASKNSSSLEKVEFDFKSFDDAHRQTICSNLAILPQQIEAVRPCTAVQQGMIAQSLHSHGAEYINSQWLELSPVISLENFREAWAATAKQHDMLRSGFVQIGSAGYGFAIVTYTKDDFVLPWYDSSSTFDEKMLVLEALSRCPWCLTVQKRGERTVVRFTAHHALYDAQSIQIILSDVAKMYISGRVTSRPPVTALLGPILMESEISEKQKIYWQVEENKIIVNRFPDLTALRTPSNLISVRELSSRLSFPSFEELCRTLSVTMQAASQASWARLLAAYVGEASTTFGMTLSGRSILGDAHMISFPSIVTLPVRCDVVGTNENLIERTMQANASILNHQFTPLTSIQKWAGFHEGNIFDTLFAYQKQASGQDELDLPWKVIDEEASVDYAISLEVQPLNSGKLIYRLTFREGLVPPDHAEMILKQYDALLIDILQNPKNQCSQAPVVDHSLLSITPPKQRTLKDDVTLLHEYVERGARDWPNRIAFEFATRLQAGNLQSQRWTYQQLDEESNKVAHLIQDFGVHVGEMIGICFDKCPEASFAIVGILKAGCSYVALDPTAPTDRLSFIVSDSCTKLVLTAGKLANKFQALNLVVAKLDTPNLLQRRQSTPPMVSWQIRADDVAYCLYTSGTTGTPKGCLITHENAVQAMLSFQILFAGHWTESSKWLQFASFHFDVSVLELFWSWSVGIRVASAPRDLIFEDIAGAIRELKITHLDLTPSLARLLTPKDVPSLCKGVFITGGEQLRQDILDEWGEVGCIYNGYGPTEATIGVTMYPRVPRNGKPSNIGPQFVNVGSFVLKPGTELPVLRGAVGELCVSGKLVGRGYLNRTELTAEKFPVLKEFDERIYRTGDLVRILLDGSFIFLGRADDQVKLRGQRLELSEINEVIKKSTSSLEEVVTLVLKHAKQQKEQLVTFFVLSSNNVEEKIGLLISSMKTACKSRLPGYMVPTHFVPIKRLPLNANNKADSKQLAAIYDNLSIDDLQQLSQSSQDKQWTTRERSVLTILADALDVELSSLTRESNIFELGLDSISIIGFARTLEKAGLPGAKLSVLKSNPMIGTMIEVLLADGTPSQELENAYIMGTQRISAFSQKHMATACEELQIRSSDIESIAPCTSMQEGMIYEFLEGDKSLYFNTFQFRLNEGVDVRKLLRAWDIHLGKSQILRTRFVATNDGYAQVVLNTVLAGVERQDFSEKVPSLTDAANLRHPFILSTSPPGHITIRIFHGLYDGNSLAMMLSLVANEYNELPNLDYGPSFHSALPYGPLVEAPGGKEFWTQHLRDWVYNPLKPASKSTADITASRKISNLEGFEDLRKQLRTTPQALVQAAWIAVLQTLKSTTLSIGMVTSGRAIDLDGAEKVLGPLFNTVPFNIKISPGMKAAALISECHQFNMEMQNYQHTPLKDIQKWSSAKPGQSLFDTLFVFQRPEAGEDEYFKDLWVQVNTEQVASYPLAFEAALVGNDLNLLLVGQGAFITEPEASNLLSKTEQILRDILKSSGSNTVYATDTLRINSTERTETIADEAIAAFTETSQAEDFQWTHEALAIRDEIALLANLTEANVSKDLSIFELGLDSIDVIKLASRLKKKRIEIPVSVIIRSKNIATMMPNISAEINNSFANTPDNQLSTMSHNLTKLVFESDNLPDNIEVVLPTTPLQQSMVNEMLKSGYQRYFNIEAFKLSAQIDAKQLRCAIQNVVDLSPILRTSFVQVYDYRSRFSFAQVVSKRISWFTGSTGTHSPADFLSIFKKDSISKAKKGSLFQVHFYKVHEERFMLIAISHALYDGTSLPLIHQNIEKAYQGIAFPNPDFKPFLEQVLRSTTDDAKNFWRNTLSNIPAKQFPLKEPSLIRNRNSVYRFAKQSKVLLEDIEHLCKSTKVTLQTLGQTCWTLVLGHLMRQLDVVFGTVISCRDTEEANMVMFPLMNTVAVRSVIHGNLSEMLKYMQDLSDTTRQYQHFSLATAQTYALASLAAGSTRTATLFDTLFIYQGRRSSTRETELYEVVSGTADVEFPVCVEMEIIDTCLTWTTACKATARDEKETEDIINILDEVLARIVANSQQPTMTSSSEGISICGLPSFQISQQKEVASKAILVDDKWTEAELSIRKALRDISDVSEEMIFKDTTIFQLGLDSILVLKLPSLLKKYGVELSVSEILRYQTISAMANSSNQAPTELKTEDIHKILSTAVDSFDESVLDVLGLGEVDYVMPITAGQLYMLRMSQLSGGVLFYPTFKYVVSTKLDKEKLQNAWTKLLARHSILRTGFVAQGAEILQVVLKNPPNQIQWDIEISEPNTDLRKPPISLAMFSSGQLTIALTIHHALYDGFSLPILLNELQALYMDQAITAPKADFRQFIAHSLTQSKAIARGKWTTYLESKAQVANLSVISGKRTEIYHPRLAIPNLKEHVKALGTSTSALLLALLAKSLPPNTPDGNLIIGIYHANRATAATLAAPALNLLPLLIRTPSRDAAQVAQEIQSDLLHIGAADMVGASLEDIYEWTGVRVDTFVNLLADIGERGTLESIFVPGDELERACVVKHAAGSEAQEGAYLHALDIEIRENGTEIDIGVFAPVERMDIAGGEEIIAGFLRECRAL